MPFKRSDAGIIVAVFAIARRSKVADFVAKPLDLARERFYRVARDEHVSALSRLLGFDAANGLAMVG